MHLAFPIAAILFAFAIDPARAKQDNATASTGCKHAAPVESFASSLYTALVVTLEPDVIAKIQLPGPKAGDLLFPIISKVLNAEGLCDADMVAFTASRALAMIKNLSLTKYFKMTAYDMGIYLHQNGYIDCHNSVPVAIDVFVHIGKILKGQDKNKFESYMDGIVKGLTDFAKVHGIFSEDSARELTDIFYQLASEKHQQTCKLAKGSN